jgi:hypothetical protein
MGNENASLIVSGGLAGNMGPSGSQSVSVLRTRNQDAGKFAIGANQVRLQADSFDGSLLVDIPNPGQSSVSIDDDLILMIFTNQFVLSSMRGYVIQTGAVSLGQ